MTGFAYEIGIEYYDTTYEETAKILFDFAVNFPKEYKGLYNLIRTLGKYKTDYDADLVIEELQFNSMYSVAAIVDESNIYYEGDCSGIRYFEEEYIYGALLDYQITPLKPEFLQECEDFINTHTHSLKKKFNITPPTSEEELEIVDEDIQNKVRIAMSNYLSKAMGGDLTFLLYFRHEECKDFANLSLGAIISTMLA